MMHEGPLQVLVLAVGGNVSQGILKALALSDLPCRVIGADVEPMKMGLYTVDRAYVSPYANSPDFLDWLTGVCREEKVDVVLSGAEPVLAVLAREAETIERETGARVIVSPPAVLEVGDDKGLTCGWLVEHGFPCPAYAMSDDGEGLRRLAGEYGYPLIAKTRIGGGARGLVRIQDEADLEYIGRKQDYLVQQEIGDADGEYTVGCFCGSDGRVRGAIAMRRRLHEGTTEMAEIGAFPEVREAAMAIVSRLKPMGPCNVQMRMHEGRPICFELNIRFSGTTPIRARLGFNEVDAALRNFVLGEEIDDLPLVTEGMMLRYWNEAYIAPEAFGALAQHGRLEDPKAHALAIEDYGMRP